MTDTPSPQPPQPTRYIDTLPAGVFLGTFHGTQSSSVSLFEKIGKGVAISALYTDWNGGFNSGLPNANAMVGRITFYTWEYKSGPEMYKDYPGGPLQALIDGMYDDYLRGWAVGVRDFGKPIFIRWGHEMNGNWYLWSGIKNGGGTLDGFGDPTKADGPERFVAAYRYIHDFFENNGATNVLWVWCPNAPFEGHASLLRRWKMECPRPIITLAMSMSIGCALYGYNWGASSFGQQFNSVWNFFRLASLLSLTANFRPSTRINRSSSVSFHLPKMAVTKLPGSRIRLTASRTNTHRYAPSSGSISTKKPTGALIHPPKPWRRTARPSPAITGWMSGRISKNRLAGNEVC